MSVKMKPYKFKITYPAVFTAVLSVHAFFLAFNGLPKFDPSFLRKNERSVLKIRRVKTPPIENVLTNVNLPVPNLSSSTFSPNKGPVSLHDLAVIKAHETEKIIRPGSRPQIGPSKINAIKQLSMQDKDFKDFAKSYPSGMRDLSTLDTRSFKISDAAIGIENPDGVEPDELNKNELVYYSFQKRMLVGYINSIVKEIEKFQLKHRHFQLDPNSKILMTARLTYDSEGNVKQIKMIRWTNLDPIQGVFEESMKNLNKLSNPPKDLWAKSGEFNVFYSWVISNG